MSKCFWLYAKFNILPYYIPGGYTFCAQPVDVVLNRPFKCNMIFFYEEHQLNSQRFSKNGNAVKPSWQKTVDMVGKATKCPTPDLIRKSFVCCGLNLAPSGDFTKYFKSLNPVLISFFDYEFCWDLEYELLNDFKKSLIGYKYAYVFERVSDFFIQPYNEEAIETFHGMQSIM
jgi:hypothetical protein